MHWRRTAAVQPVGALIALGADAPVRILAAMAAKSTLFAVCPFAQGADWIVVLAATDAGSDSAEGLLPRLDGTTPLYESTPGLWLPVGTALDVPDHAAEAVTDALLQRHGVTRPAVVIPRFRGSEEAARQADLYVLENMLPIAAFASDAELGIPA
jgi:hypothetical protein